MRVLFAGSPSLAIPALAAIQQDHDVCGVLTNPDQPQGRSKDLQPTPVKQKALELGLRVLHPKALDEPFYREIATLKPELLVVAAYGRIFKKAFIDLFPLGGVNLHPSLLPRFRGPSPITAAILSGDRETGVTIQRLALKMDAGPILAVERVPLDGTETTPVLTEQLAALGVELLIGVLNALEAGRIEEIEQNETKATYCRLVRKTDGCINWGDSAERIDRMIRAYQPWPGTFTSFGSQRLNILDGGVCPECHPEVSGGKGLVFGSDKRYGVLVQTGQGILYINRMQLQSKKALDWQAFLNGNRTLVGSLLGGNE